MASPHTDERTPRFTVLTPTYNRANTLRRVFDSIVAQQRADIEWLVIDDGSTDGTESIIASLTREAPLTVRYHRQPNGHKKTALNTGFRLARGAFTIILDSDDALLPDAIAIYEQAWDRIPMERRDYYCGIRALCVDEAGIVVGDEFPTDDFDASASELVYKYRVGGEKLSCDRTELLRKFPFPDDIAGLVPEQVLWSQLSRDYRYRCVNQPTRIYHDGGADSLSRKLATGDFSADAAGLFYASSFLVDHDAHWFWTHPLVVVKLAANRTRFLHHLPPTAPQHRFRVRTLGGRLLVIAFGWIGHLLYLRDSRRMAARQPR